jgi:Asp/Glu/hydantoin racemase
MRICVINPFAGTEHYGAENLQRIAAPGTTFDMVAIGERYPLSNNQWLFFRQSCTGPTIDRAIQAQRDGYDAVFISCNLDIGLYECRQMCTIPVTATLESAALVAHMMGRRFSLLSVDDQNGQIQRMMLEQYQLDKGLVSVRSFGMDANDLYVERTDPQETIRRVVATARRCLERDGAEVLIAGCTLAGSGLSRFSRDNPDLLPAPILDGMLTGFKMAEMMATLQQRAGLPPVSRLGMFEQPPVADLARLRAAQGQPMPVWAER